MDLFADVQEAETESPEWTGTRRKRIRGRFRATLAGLLELEVLRVRHKEMVETALGIHERPSQSVNSELQQRHQYWVEESSNRLKLKRSLSQENITDSGKNKTLVNLNMVAASHSSEDIQQLYGPDLRPAPEYTVYCSRASSGFCESDFGDIYTHAGDAINSLSASVASLSYPSTVSDVGYSGRRPVLLKNREDPREKNSKETQVFSKEVIPEAGFLSVVDLYPDSHWPDVSDILQPHMVLEPSYRSDLISCLGSEVYRYPSPLHAVALQSPLYAPQSPIKHRKRNDRCFPGSSTLNLGSILRPNSFNSVPKQTIFEHPSCRHPELTSMLQSSMSLPGNCKCMEIILKRAQFHYWSQSTAKNIEGIHTLSRRSTASLQRTCSMGKSATTASFKFKHFQSRRTGECASDLASTSESGHTGFKERHSTHKNRLRRHTAALTNLNMFKDSNAPSVSCGVFLDRRCSVQSFNTLNLHSSSKNSCIQKESANNK